MHALLDLFRRYRIALRDEPKLRTYLAASIVDDVGVALSGWASMLLLTNLFTDQRARAQLTIPALCCFLVGAVISGPLADWTTSSIAKLSGFRHRLVVVARLVETAMLAGLVVVNSQAPPTIGRILPYVMLTAFMKTALRPARTAFEVDLLEHDAPQLSADGSPLLDERGAPRMYKLHLLTFGSLIGSLRLFAALIGLLLGERIMALAGHRYWVLFALDVVTNLGFVTIVAIWCRPPAVTESPEAHLPEPTRDGVVIRFGKSIREGIAFLAAPEQRVLLALLGGCFLIEVVTETYDGKIIVKHVLHGSNESVRYAVIGYTLVSAIGLALVPMLAHRIGSLGKIFLITMLVDGLLIALAGRIAGGGSPSAIRPFVIALCADHTLTLTSSSLAELAQNSASSAAMRGRIAAIYAFAVLLGDMAAEVVATRLAETIGIPAMMVRVGFVQVAVMLVIAIVFGKRLWRFGLRVEPAPAPNANAVAESAA